MNSHEKIKVLIVDDSALIRQTLLSIISSMKNMEVIGTASDPYVAVQLMKKMKPDVLTLDLQMPKMDGLTFLKKIMSQHPIPTVVISSLTSANSKLSNEAYRLGAISVLDKPKFTDTFHDDWISLLGETLTTAANSNITKRIMPVLPTVPDKAPQKNIPQKKNIEDIILIGSSAGGTEIVNFIVSNLKIDSPPVLIVQHMPEVFTAAYAERLNSNSKIEVREASTGDIVHKGLALVAPGNNHMELKNNGTHYFVDINSKPRVNRHRPSVDMLFNSALNHKGINITAIILSGMGSDGALSMLNLKEKGATTIAQSPESCIVYGMPKSAIEMKAAIHILPPDRIISKINEIK